LRITAKSPGGWPLWVDRVISSGAWISVLPPIVLQKAKVADLRISRENMKRETIADSDNLNRVTEVACEFNVKR
jgi:hypothetical protein